jgi:AcrR family transcriptional regulator
VPDSPADPRQSLRERKKQATRRMLVEAAVELCVKQGYETTTVEQIAAAAEISTRTFSRYFATKDAVFVAVLDDLADEIARELTSQPRDLGPMEALRAAHMAVLERASRGPLEGLTTDRVALILRIVNASDALQQAAIDYRAEAVIEILAERMGVSPDDRNLDLAVALFSTTIVRACEDLTDDGDAPLGPRAIMDRLDATLGHVAQFAAEMDVRPQAG